MSAHPPPVPPANRSDKGPGEPADTQKSPPQAVRPSKAPNNADEEDRTGNSKINTTNQGYQQDR
ncbi:MAG: hypothetical protein JOZ05_07605 [Acetobacteraceae bacterium]|nr:hypothetical protein [Acetobacteraceae bacterium]